MAALAWITGASSGIGEELARQAGPAVEVVGISRRPPRFGAHLEADLADAAGWRAIGGRVADALGAERPERALFLHFAGTMEPIGPVAAVDPAAYEAAILLNSAAGQVLGAAFLRACAAAAVPATLVLCSSPAARAPRPGAAQYSAGKAALEAWAGAVAAEHEDAADATGGAGAARVLCVVPHRVDTAMVRGAMAAPTADLPLGRFFRDSAAAGELASPARAAAEIWAAIEGDAPSGAVIAVGSLR